jgi:geranylgeranyl reductase family protein
LPVTRPEQADVIVVGGGPAGSVVAWQLARAGARTILLERACFPREKVCGDFVDPRGLKILDSMGCLAQLERGEPRRVTRTATYVDGARQFSGPVPFYGLGDRFPPHGYTIRRKELDSVMLESAAAAGADVHQQTNVVSVDAGTRGVRISARRGSRSVRYTGGLVVGADGVNSIVARSQGLLQSDPRRMAVARRAYAAVEGDGDDTGAAEIFFSESFFPGYGWVFPGSDGSVNLGIGVLSEAVKRSNMQLPSLFTGFVEALRHGHPAYAHVQLDSRPIGGVVKTYGAAGRNHFDGGVLVGDAGCFVDPLTGEGITPGMQSALMAADALSLALATGDHSSAGLASYEARFRAYFDVTMLFQDLSVVMVSNRHLAGPWLKALARGYQMAQWDSSFARVSGSYFGGLEPRPAAILRQLWGRTMQDVLLAWPRFAATLAADSSSQATTPRDLLEWQSAMARSMLRDPRWHARWMLDVQRHWVRFLLALRRHGETRSAPVPPAA